jgi:heterotetrameric sarcosine oxidase delta subunit
MLLIDCPHCGPRSEQEFAYGGEAHIARPTDPDRLSDQEWADYLFMRTNPKGPHYERWVHAHGCRRWFNMLRNTATNEILAIYKIDDPRPDLPAPSQTGAGKRP